MKRAVKSMYKLAGRFDNLPVTPKEAQTILKSQQTVGVVKDSRDTTFNKTGLGANIEKAKEERVNFLQHLMTGKPMEVRQPQVAPEKIPTSIQTPKASSKQDASNQKGSLQLRLDGDSSPRTQRSSALKEPSTVRNKEFFDRVIDQAIKIREKERQNAGKTFEKDEDEEEEESSEEKIKDLQLPREEDSE